MINNKSISWWKLASWYFKIFVKSCSLVKLWPSLIRKKYKRNSFTTLHNGVFSVSNGIHFLHGSEFFSNYIYCIKWISHSNVASECLSLKFAEVFVILEMLNKWIWIECTTLPLHHLCRFDSIAYVVKRKTTWMHCPIAAINKCIAIMKILLYIYFSVVQLFVVNSYL